MRKSSFEKSSSLPGMVASCLISSIEMTLPSTMPSLKVNSAFSVTQVEIALVSATGSPDGVGDGGDALQPLERRFDLRALRGTGRQLVLEHAVLAARLTHHLAQVVILRHGELGKGADDGAGRALELCASFVTFSAFFCSRQCHKISL